MNVARIAKSSRKVEEPVEGLHISTEETLLHSYDRFYKAVNKFCKDIDVQSLPRLETVLGPSVKLPKERAKQLKSVWECAEKFTQVHGVVQKFHRYRHDLAKQARRRSRTASLTSTEVEDNSNQLTKLEDRMDHSEAAVVGLEAKLDRLTSVVSEAVEKLRCRQEEAAKKTFDENRQQMDRIEQWLQNLDAKLNQLGKESGNADVTLTCVGWPEMMHNNIAYSSSEGSSIHGALASDLTIGDDSVHDAAVAVRLDDPTSEEPPHYVSTTSKQRLRMHLEARPVDTAMPLASFDVDAINPCRSRATLDSTSTSLTRSTSLISSFNKEHRSSDSGRRATIVPVDDAFDEAFLRDVLRVQENIRSSDLGRPISERDGCVPRTLSTCSDISPSEIPFITENNEGAFALSSFVSHRMESVSFLDSALSEICMSEPHSPMIPRRNA